MDGRLVFWTAAIFQSMAIFMLATGESLCVPMGSEVHEAVVSPDQSFMDDYCRRLWRKVRPRFFPPKDNSGCMPPVVEATIDHSGLVLKTKIIRGGACKRLAGAAESSIWYAAPYPEFPDGAREAAVFLIRFDRHPDPGGRRIVSYRSGIARPDSSSAPDRSLQLMAAKIKGGELEAVDAYFQDMHDRSLNSTVARNIWMQVALTEKSGGRDQDFRKVLEAVPDYMLGSPDEKVILTRIGKTVEAGLKVLPANVTWSRLAESKNLCDSLAELFERLAIARQSAQ